METSIILSNFGFETYLIADVSICSRRATSLKKMEESALHHFRDARKGTRQAHSEADRGPSNPQEISSQRVYFEGFRSPVFGHGACQDSF